jgi:hypothetical protein
MFESYMKKTRTVFAVILFLAHFGAPPIFGAKEIDRVSKKSLYYRDLSDKRP